MLQATYGEDAAALHAQMDVLLADAKTPPHVKVDILKFKIERISGKTPQALTLGGPDDNALKKLVIEWQSQSN